ncbi:sigma-70 family RNA polymerase sigma factor [Labedaea rhizosphaerae]|uniref:RNA polymerase sigma factor (Sigma-70 family) n=1 Tax=Labedaea rhizosphaerae TaxID=598644 RepID=A0A4R6S296_LABRH|nr:sigma-70 family RNA polymerase sigma factor [Labedaea rhizosphaerae]TDP93671.1 RNA polymerase sigma factor (sigma-70 family) [Labedaea rhizosphaerae]
MATVPADVQGPSDAELIQSVRDGSVDAYGSLYERHVGAAYNLARQLTRSAAEADDLVSEAFAKVLDTLRAGRGPDSAFRAYLLTALRHTAYDKTRRDRKVELSDDVSTVSGVSQAAVSVPFSDTAVAGLERSLAARAFEQLPERWQAVLWHTEIEGQSPADVAPILGLTPNGVSALAYRAREGLRQAYLQVHLAETSEERCRICADRLGAWTRGGLSKREKAQVETHLDDCDRCRALAAELADVNGALRGFVAPLVLGIGATGYLAASGTTAKAATLVAAGTTAGGASGAAGALTSGPRQFVGVAASATVLVAAVALGLTAGGGTQEVPAAQPQPVVQTPTPAPAPPAKPVPAKPVPAPPPPPPQQQSPSSTTPPPPPPPPPSPTPGPPKVTAQGPSQTITLTPGSPVDVPITIRNTGGTAAPAPSATLNLPDGVRAMPPTANFAARPMLDLAGARAVTVTTNCPGGRGTVTCHATQELAPGGTAVLKFRLAADASSKGGVVTGSVMAGAGITVKITVDVKVTPPPSKDDVLIQASAEWLDLLLPGLRWNPTVDVTALNTGTSTKPITIHVSDPDAVPLPQGAVTLACTRDGGGMTCTSDPIAPHHAIFLRFQVHWPTVGTIPNPAPHHRVVAVMATLGAASDTAEVPLHWWPWPVPPPDPHPKPTPQPEPGHNYSPTTTTTPSPTTSQSPSSPSRTTTTAPTTTTTTKKPPATKPTTGGGNGSATVVPGPPNSGSTCTSPTLPSARFLLELLTGQCKQ